MSSRALRRLQKEESLIKVGREREESSEEDQPGFSSGKSKQKAGTVNPFAALLDDEHESDRDGDAEGENGSQDSTNKATSTASSLSAKKKKKRKKSKQHQQEENSEPRGGVEEVDAAIKEVNEMLGEVQLNEGEVPSGAEPVARHKPLLYVERRLLKAENEMKKIFGSRVVRAEAGRQRVHRRVRHRSTMFATPKDTWPKMDKPGLSMEMASESKEGCQFFVFKHSPEYQKVQYQFYNCVKTFRPESIAHVLQSHPYHIDSLLQLSEVCKMSDDPQMATELLERALYCFESSFHTLFNVTHGNCRLNYSIAENRPFFIALFRHLYYIGRKGCHRTALEYCKLLLSLDPDGDPLCVLLMIDYYALRAEESSYFLTLFEEWESERNLSQLPNFALSVPLALFHRSCHSGRNAESAQSLACGNGGARGLSQLAEANAKLQEALIMFPGVLLPLMEKCQVTLDPVIMKHEFFNSCTLDKDPKALQLLLKLFVERNHSLWKAPEVLTWLEESARQVVARVDRKDPLVAESTAKRSRRFAGPPRNIYRHVIMSDFDQVTAGLPADIASGGIMMYDPLPPLDSVSCYPPTRTFYHQIDEENSVLLFLRSFFPSFTPEQFAESLGEIDPAEVEQAAVELRGLGRDRLVSIRDQMNSVLGMIRRMVEREGEEEGEESDGYDSTSTSDEGPSDGEHT